MNGDLSHSWSGEDPQASGGSGMIHGAGSPGPNPYATSHLPPLVLTTGRWFNSPRTNAKGEPDPGKWDKIIAITGPFSQYAYGTDTSAGVIINDLERHPGGLQIAIIGSPQTGVLPLDVDLEAEYMTLELARHVNREHAISTRGGGYHVLIDMRGVPPELWPRQGGIYGANDLHCGDLKAAGFIPKPGSVHGTGCLYEPVVHPGGWVRIVVCTPEILAALHDARSRPVPEPGPEPAAPPRAARAGTGGKPASVPRPSGGQRGVARDLPPTEFLLQHGVDHPHDHNMLRLAGRLARQGVSEEQAYAIWRRVADLTQDPAAPFTYADDFLDQWQRGLKKYGSKPLPASFADGVRALVSAGQSTCLPVEPDTVHDLHVPYEKAPPARVRTWSELTAKEKGETKFYHPRNTDNQSAPPGFSSFYEQAVEVAKENAWQRAQQQAGSQSAGDYDWDRLWFTSHPGYPKSRTAELARRPEDGFVFHPGQLRVRGLEAHIAFCLHNEAGPLLEEAGDGLLRLLGDAKTVYHTWKCHCRYKKHSSENYPNCPPGICPLDGDALDLAFWQKAIRATRWGSELTDRQVAALINLTPFRVQMRIPLTSRYVSKSGVEKARQRAQAREEMKQDRKPVLYRRGRCYLTDKPAHYTVFGCYAQNLLDRIDAACEQLMPDVVRRLARLRPPAALAALPVSEHAGH